MVCVNGGGIEVPAALEYCNWTRCMCSKNCKDLSQLGLPLPWVGYICWYLPMVADSKLEGKN